MLNVLLMSVEHYQQHDLVTLAVSYANLGFTGFFTLEAFFFFPRFCESVRCLEPRIWDKPRSALCGPASPEGPSAAELQKRLTQQRDENKAIYQAIRVAAVARKPIEELAPPPFACGEP